MKLLGARVISVETPLGPCRSPRAQCSVIPSVPPFGGDRRTGLLGTLLMIRRCLYLLSQEPVLYVMLSMKRFVRGLSTSRQHITSLGRPLARIRSLQSFEHFRASLG